MQIAVLVWRQRLDAMPGWKRHFQNRLRCVAAIARRWRGVLDQENQLATIRLYPNVCDPVTGGHGVQLVVLCRAVVAADGRAAAEAVSWRRGRFDLSRWAEAFRRPDGPDRP